MQNQSENHQLLMHNVPIDRFKSLEVFLNCFKKNNIPHFIRQYNGKLFAEFFIQLIQGFRKYLFYFLVEVMILISNTS